MQLSSSVRVSGPLAPLASDLWRDLESRGYTMRSRATQIGLLNELSRFVGRSADGASVVSEAQLEAFLRSRRAAGHSQYVSGRGIEPIRRVLLAGAILVGDSVPAASTPAERLLGEYRVYLEQERGLTAEVTKRYLAVAGRFLDAALQPESSGLSQLSASHVHEFAGKVARKESKGYLACIYSALRSLLRYLHVRGQVSIDLTSVVPSLAGWTLTGVPRFLGPEQFEALLASCDRRSSIGRRDHAILLLLGRMGLRSGEVTSLTLDDVLWRAGEIHITGKGARQDRLPLPAEVGAAIAAHLRLRPRWIASRALFLGSRAPYASLDPASITSVVARACRRSKQPVVGAHRLRHTVATQMLRAGASLPEVAQVLRHRSLGSTAIYAKVDHLRLREVARPWIGSVGIPVAQKQQLLALARSWAGGAL